MYSLIKNDRVIPATGCTAHTPLLHTNDHVIDVLYNHVRSFYTVQQEDEDAGDAGVPFTHAEHEEEWMGWVDWENMGA